MLYAGRSRALDVALRHLSCLGARAQARPGGGDAPATLEVVLPGGSVPEVGCRVDWSCGAAPGGPDDETSVQAATGVMAVHGRRVGGPVRLPLDYASACAGVLAVQGVLAALVARERGGQVRRVGTSVVHAALLAVSQYLAAATGDEEEVLPPDDPAAGPPFRSRDGVWFEAETLDAGPWRAFWSALGVPPADVSRGWRPFMLRFSKAVSPLPRSLAAAVAARDFADLAATAEATGVSLCRIRTLAERRLDPGLFTDGAVAGPWRITPYAVSPAGTGTAAGGRPPSVERPLEGLTVVEAGRRVQAPLAAHVLHLLGAEVIRVEPPDGDPLRGMPPMAGDCSARFLALNKGKGVLHADLKAVEGRAAVVDLLRGADAFLHNWAPGKAAVFGLDSDALSAVNPRLVFAHASGWGDALGPRPPLGTDFMAQAHSGLAHTMGGEAAPRPSLMTLIDVLGGLVAAEGMLAGLLLRERTGRGARVDSSLLSATTVLQYAALEGGPRHGRSGCAKPAVPDLTGPWRTADGRLAVSAASHTAVGRLCRALGLDPGLPADALGAAVAARLLERSARSWAGTLAAAGVTATEVVTDVRDLERSAVARPALTRAECVFVTAPWRFEA
ncbi:CoA transferase [Streptomyces caatingaensis]|uniref:CoA transferase n=1 Tax=Streptomyces caatingaensis TaxID=1678637 RepID=UPI00069E05BA|nr:CoA transferase [Streptomyces caatingaensis]